LATNLIATGDEQSKREYSCDPLHQVTSSSFKSRCPAIVRNSELGASTLRAEIELGIHEQGEGELARDPHPPARG
jgi:hypothetical protein